MEWIAGVVLGALAVIGVLVLTKDKEYDEDMEEGKCSVKGEQRP